MGGLDLDMSCGREWDDDIEGRRRSASYRGGLIVDAVNRQDGVRSRLDGFPTETTVSGMPVRVRVLAEAGKVDLNAANVSMFAALLRSQGVSSAEADVLAERIVAWRTPLPQDSIDVSDGPYRDSGRSYGPRLAQFRTVDEVRLVAGVSQALFTAIRPLVTVYSPKASVDRQTASDAVLGVLEESGDGLADSQLQARQAGNPSGIDRPLSVGEAVSIEASIAFEDGKTLRTAVVRIGGDARAPYWILDWR